MAVLLTPVVRLMSACTFSAAELPFAKIFTGRCRTRGGTRPDGVRRRQQSEADECHCDENRLNCCFAFNQDLHIGFPLNFGFVLSGFPSGKAEIAVKTRQIFSSHTAWCKSCSTVLAFGGRSRRYDDSPFFTARGD